MLFDSVGCGSLLHSVPHVSPHTVRISQSWATVGHPHRAIESLFHADSPDGAMSPLLAIIARPRPWLRVLAIASQRTGACIHFVSLAIARCVRKCRTLFINFPGKPITDKMGSEIPHGASFENNTMMLHGNDDAMQLPLVGHMHYLNDAHVVFLQEVKVP